MSELQNKQISTGLSIFYKSSEKINENDCLSWWFLWFRLLFIKSPQVIIDCIAISAALEEKQD